MKTLLIRFNNLYHFLVDLYLDFKFRIKTTGEISLDQLQVDSPHKDHGRKYQPGRSLIVRRALKKLPPNLFSRPFVDLGCGKGRILFLAAEMGAKKLIGVDFSPLLIRDCINNFHRAKIKSEVGHTLVLADVVDFKIPDDVGIIFLFNPFDSYILSMVIENIERRQSKDEAYIVYVNPLRDFLFSQRKNFTLIHKLDHFNHNNQVAIFKHIPSGIC